jgi:DNA-binding CsgD family transcriptional regulator
VIRVTAALLRFSWNEATVLRAKEALFLHRQGQNYLQIANRFKLTRERVRQLINIAIQLESLEEAPDNGLSVRTHNALVRGGIEEISPEAVKTHFPTLERLARIPGMGEKAIEELQDWLGKNGAEKIQ